MPKRNLLIVVENKSKYNSLEEATLSGYFNVDVVSDFVEANEKLKNLYDTIFLELQGIALLSPEKIPPFVPETIYQEYNKDPINFVGKYLLEKIRNDKCSLNKNTPIIVRVDGSPENRRDKAKFISMGATNVIYIPSELDELEEFIKPFDISLESLKSKYSK
ncbi:MAG: hypothetical protein WC812_01400 [Candidatus Pacearchaeota archaeon]|jgi:hypothetical protein